MSRHISKPTTTIRIRTDVLKALAAAADTTEARTAMGIKLAGEGPVERARPACAGRDHPSHEGSPARAGRGSEGGGAMTGEELVKSTGTEDHR